MIWTLEEIDASISLSVVVSGFIPPELLVAKFYMTVGFYFSNLQHIII